MKLKELQDLVNHKLVTDVTLYEHYESNPEELDKLDVKEAMAMGLVSQPEVSAAIAKDGIAILPNNMISTAEDLMAEIALHGIVKLTNNMMINQPIMITKDTVIDLNGYTIESTQDVFDVSAKLTIDGNGKVIAASDNTCSWCAIFAHDSADVTVNGGEYSIGAPDGDYNDLIYARDNAKITINGGTYHASGSVRNDGTAFVLNLKDNSNASIVVNGGTFDGFNPAKANTEPGSDYNFVADGYESVEDPTGVWKVSKVEIVVDENDEVVSE